MQRAPSAVKAVDVLAAPPAAASAPRPAPREERRSGTSADRPDALPPPPYSQAPPPYSADPGGEAPPEHAATPGHGFDPRELTDFQLDELVHRIIGRVTRLIRTELRTDRERVGRLRDPRF